jgi:hypothetical protein
MINVIYAHVTLREAETEDRTEEGRDVELPFEIKKFFYSIIKMRSVFEVKIKKNVRMNAYRAVRKV